MTTIDEFLTHHGVKGMKWGVRRSRSAGSPPSPDFTRANKTLTTVKTNKGRTSSLSNKELKDVNERLRLENEFNRLRKERQSAGRKFAAKLLGSVGQQQAFGIANEQATALRRSKGL